MTSTAQHVIGEYCTSNCTVYEGLRFRICCVISFTGGMRVASGSILMGNEPLNFAVGPKKGAYPEILIQRDCWASTEVCCLCVLLFLL